jgi:hypothetical protein
MAAGVGHGLREVHKLQVSENNVVRKIFGSKREGKTMLSGKYLEVREKE